MRERSPSSGVSIGGLTVLVIFTVLCLTIFSVISLSSAQADLRLSDKNIEQTIRYYNADGKAEEQLQRLDQTLTQAATGSPESGVFWQKLSGSLSGLDTREGKGSFDLLTKRYSCELPVSDVLALRMVVEIAYDGAGKADWTVVEWKTHSTLDYEIDESITLWDGQ